MLRLSWHLTRFDSAQGWAHPIPSWPIATSLRTMRAAWSEALAAYRRYEHLTAKGIPHDPALKEALGIAPCDIRSAGSRTARAKPLVATDATSDSVAAASRSRGQPRIGNLTFVR